MPTTLHQPEFITKNVAQSLARKAKPHKEPPQEAKTFEGLIRSNKHLGYQKQKNKLSNKYAKDAKLFKVSGVRAKTEKEKGLNFQHYQWRKVVKKYDLYKKDGSKILTTLRPNDIIGVRFISNDAGGKVITVRGYQWGVSADDYMDIVEKHAELLPFSSWPETTITPNQIEANLKEDHAQAEAEQARIRQEKARAQAEERKAQKLEREAKAAEEARLRRLAKAQQKADEEAFLERARKTKEEREQKALEERNSQSDAVYEYLKGDRQAVEEIEDELDEFDLNSLDDVDIEDDQDQDSGVIDMGDEYLNPEDRPIKSKEVADAINKGLDEHLNQLKTQAQEFDLNTLEGEDDDLDALDGLEDLDDEDDSDELEDVNDSELEDEEPDEESDDSDELEDEDPELDDSESDSDEDELEDDELEDVDDSELEDDELEDVDDSELEDDESDELEDEDPETADEDDLYDDESEDEMPISEMLEILIEEGVVEEDADLKPAEIQKLFDETMESEDDGDEDLEDEEDQELDEEDDEDEYLGDLDELDGPSDSELEDDGVDDLDDDDLDSDESLEDIPDDVEDQDTDDDEPEEIEESDIVSFRHTDNDDQYVVLNINVLPQNSAVLVYKVYNITKKPEWVQTVRVSVDEKKGFGKYAKRVGRMPGSEFVSLYLSTDNLPKNPDPIA